LDPSFFSDRSQKLTEIYFNRYVRGAHMAKKKGEGPGLMSSAGLMRYFESEETSIKLDPKMVIGAGIASGVAIMALNITFGLWP